MAALSRLRTAVSSGQISLPAGPVHVMRPPVGYDLAGLDRDRVHILQTFYPDHLRWSEAGFSMAAPDRVSTTLVVLPRSKSLAQTMIAQACATSDLVVVDGGKTDGVGSLWTAAKKRLGALPSVAKDHGRLFWFPATDAFADWAQSAPSKAPMGYVTQPGVFSDGAVDRGSDLLAQALPADVSGHVADFGAGWGYLGAQILTRPGIKSLTMIEAEALALDCARANVTDDRARFVWTDATTFKSDTPFDAVIMNPPFHVRRAGDPELGKTFIRAAASALSPRGHLWMVANRHLPYEAVLADCFHIVAEQKTGSGFKILHANRPRR